MEEKIYEYKKKKPAAQARREFKQTFMEPLKAQGFRYVKGTFFRINGEILQGIGMDLYGLSTYICLCMTPYWSAKMKDARDHFEFDAYRNAWTANGDQFYSAVGEQNFFEALEIYQKKYAKTIDTINDQMSWIEYTKKRYSTAAVSSIDILYASYLKGGKQYALEWKKKELEETLQYRIQGELESWQSEIERFEKNPEEALRFEQYRTTPPLRKMTREEVIESITNTVYEQYDNMRRRLVNGLMFDDLNWVKRVHDQQEEQMRAFFTEEWKLKF